MEVVQSSAENTDMEEKFEDATDTNETSPDISPSSKKTTDPNHAAVATESPSKPPVPPRTLPAAEDEETDEIKSIDTRKEKTKSTPPAILAPGLSIDETEAKIFPETSSEDAGKSSGVSGDQLATSTTANTAAVAPPKPSPRLSRFHNLSASLPSVPWGSQQRRASEVRAPSPQPQPQPQSQPQATGPGILSRKVTTPFGWLSRTTNPPKEQRSPPLLPKGFGEYRRNTSASMFSFGGTQDLMLKTLEEGQENPNGPKSPARTSLKEKFKMLRLREEAGINSLDDTETGDGGAIAGLIGRSTSLGVGIATPQGVAEEGKVISTPVDSPDTTSAPDLALQAEANPSTANASDIPAVVKDVEPPIDWDFWQTVVNEGPAAVVKTSPEELNNSISSGIPQTIRGVIWQVLAGSKNDDLENVYHEILTKGPTAEVKNFRSNSVSNGTLNGSTQGEDSVLSSNSSVHSDHSTPGTSATMGGASQSPSIEIHDPIIDAKIHVQVAAERAKKAKEDAAALSKLEKMIKRDMGSRTSYSKYAAAAGFQESLFNVCKAYALFDDAVGYPQGMNFIIMPLLFTMSEEETFCLLVRLMNKYQLRDLFIGDMPGLHLHLYQFERLLEDLEPALYCHLNRRGVTPKLYATQWFLTMFAYRFPLQLVMRVYDLVLCYGLEVAILKFGMAVVQRNVTTLLAMSDMQSLTNFLKEKIFDVYIDAAPSTKSILESGFFGSSGGSDNEVYRADLLVQDACAVKLTPEMLNKYREEWNEKIKIERARETELENLKTDTNTKATQIKSLETRAQKSDAEHIEIVNELVKLKVENSELQDVNESLRGQVQELRKVADSEAQKVEDRLRASTEKVMQQNIEVQNQNRGMEESMSEMERELVEMKMKYAELSADHEGLKQRWSDLKRALD